MTFHYVLSLRIFRSSAVPGGNWRLYKRLGKLPYWPSWQLRGLFLPWGLRPSSKPCVEPFQRPFQSWHGKFRSSFSLSYFPDCARTFFIYFFKSYVHLSNRVTKINKEFLRFTRNVNIDLIKNFSKSVDYFINFRAATAGKAGRQGLVLA